MGIRIYGVEKIGKTFYMPERDIRWLKMIDATGVHFVGIMGVVRWHVRRYSGRIENL